VNACTIIARNYLPHARVLAESFREHHPGATFTVLVVDDTGTEDRSGEPFAVLSPYEIGIDHAEVHRMAFIYDVKEFATALKPWLLEHLLSEADHAVYFDPDIEVFAPLDDIAELARAHGVVLTPHVTQPLPRDQLLPSEEMLLRAGMYNLGFIAVGEGSTPFLDWWQKRLARSCIVDVERGIFVDQRWIDFVPALFEHTILGDTACNVAYWNLSHRRVEWTGTRYEVDGAPLRFFHYSGFSPSTMELSAHMGDVPRILLEDHPDVRRLCESYAGRLYAQGFGQVDGDAYRFDVLPNGLEVDSGVRRDVREALLAADETAHTEAPCPDPFDPLTVDAFLDWLGEPVEPGEIPRHLAAVYRRRGDLRQWFPEVKSGDGRQFVQWAYATRRDRPGVAKAALTRGLENSRYAPLPDSRLAAFELWLHELANRHRWLAPLATAYARLRRSLRRRPESAPPEVASVPSFPPLPGVNVAGYFRAELGVGEAARRLITGLDAGGIPSSTITYRRTWSRQEHPFSRDAGLAAYDTNIVCVNADEIANFRADAPNLFHQRYTIGLWFWEVSRFPRALQHAFEHVDEIWVASDYVRNAISPATTKPVLVAPLPVETPPRPLLTRADVGLPEGFVFLFSFDFLSVPERKNTTGLIEAFTRAFTPGEGPTLVVKTINGDRAEESLERLRRLAAGREDIQVVDGYVTARERDALMALCDCYVSLHRSEGYGLTMAEAMAAAKPVIATAYSGNMAFMHDGNSLLVPYRLSAIPEGCDPYPPGAEWADPDLDEAARLMRFVWEDPDAARRLGRRAKEDVLRRNSPQRTAEFIARRLDEIRAERSAKAADTRRAPLPGAPLLETGRRYPTRLARRMLHRLLWPYFVEQQSFESAVAEALRAHDSYVMETSAREAVASSPLSGVPDLPLPEPEVADPAVQHARVERG
jgi:glycosyltransferase involved in cell wall biosynthesis